MVSSFEAQNVYVTNDEEIKEGDWYITVFYNEVYQATKETQIIMSDANLDKNTTYKNTHFKIVLTTDRELIKKGVQAIGDEFLDWFCKNPSCEDVEVQKWFDSVDFLEYKIIIPSEESKSILESTKPHPFHSKKNQQLLKKGLLKKETLEEEPKQEIELVNGFLPTSIFEKQATLKEVAERIAIDSFMDMESGFSFEYSLHKLQKKFVINAMISMVKWQGEQILSLDKEKLIKTDNDRLLYQNGVLRGMLRKIELQNQEISYSEEEAFKLTLDALDLGMKIRQDQLSGYSEKSGKELHKEWFGKFKKNKL
jgi:hypothetical protein